MSATVGSAMSSTISGVLQRPRLISGVCANLAERAGTAVWLPRAAFLLLGAMHWFVAIVLYVVLAKTICAARRRIASVGSSARTYVAAEPDLPDMRDRFGGLDARLASLEAATLQEEARLRHAFRDLEARR